MININLSGVVKFVKTSNLDTAEINSLHTKIKSHSMGGWMEMPFDIHEEQIDRINKTADRFRGQSEYIVVTGAGGSSLGARMLIDALGKPDSPVILYAGDNLSAIRISRLLQKISNHDFSVVVSSKSGTTLETLLAFRTLYSLLQKKYGDRAPEHIAVVTEDRRTALRNFALEAGAYIFTIPENVGGRYSVFTPAGLLPAACADVDITRLITGAVKQEKTGFAAAAQFASARNSLYNAGYKKEIFATFEPDAENFGAWWRQLFGESEGKEGGGLFPSTVTYTGDLHSMGQYIQEGPRDLYETILMFDDVKTDYPVAPSVFPDGLSALESRSFAEINRLAQRAVIEAHLAGGAPAAEITAPTFDEYGFGMTLQFFSQSCAASCFLRGVDPFYQPGVEAYKKRVKQSLGT